MNNAEQNRQRSLSHQDYLDRLQRPTREQWRRISDIQKRKESEVDSKYHTIEEHAAATKIQKAYRGHRERRQLEGFTLDPSSRWVEVIREWRYRSATVTLHGARPSPLSTECPPPTPSEVARQHWQRAAQIAEHAAGAETKSLHHDGSDYMSVKPYGNSADADRGADTLLMDMRYFLEMVDQKHRYGTNLQVYHEEWLRSNVAQNFFFWLDYGDGKRLDLSGCSRAKLDTERIRYLSKEERLSYLVKVDDEGRLRWRKNDELISTNVEQYMDSMAGIVSKNNENVLTYEQVSQQPAGGQKRAPCVTRKRSARSRRSSNASTGSSSRSSEVDDHDTVDQSKDERKSRKKFRVSPATILNQLLRASIKPGTWIYVADTVGRLYVGIKSSGAFQHASFLAGARISSAGSIGIDNGELTYLSPLSGHYRPTTKSFRVFINSLTNQGVDMSHVQVSHAYEILRGMEYYARSKKGARKVFHHRQREGDRRSKRPGLQDQLLVAMNDLSTVDSEPATSLVEYNWEREHSSGFAKLRYDHISKRRLRRLEW